MKTLHRWIRSGNYSLLSHIDASQEKRPRLGVVIVPPFGWEDVCSYRPLRFMAQTFANRGIPTLRYDLPGTGDSSGDARDRGLFDAWIQSVGSAAWELRESTGVEDVAVVGIRLGAMLAVAAAARGANIQDLVLWGAAATGRSVLRALRATALMERWEFVTAEDAPPQPIPGFEVGGFLIAPETEGILEGFDLSTLSCPRCRRVLLLSRDALPNDSKLTAALRASVPTLEIATGRGYSSMLALPHEATPPHETSLLIAKFLINDGQNSARSEPATPSRRHLETDHIGAGTEFHESVYVIESSPSPIFGILAEPGPTLTRSEYCILYLNPGGARHTGPNRMWVESARRWAARGVVSLRLDLEGIGESDGVEKLSIPALYDYGLVVQIGMAIESLRSRAGVQRFAVIGLCSGAYWAFHEAFRNSDIRAAILLNPRLLFWDPEADRKRILRRTVQAFKRWTDWCRLLRGGVQFQDLKRAVRMVAGRFRRRDGTPDDGPLTGPETMEQAWFTLERNRVRVALVFREGEPLLAELEKAGQLPPETNTYVRCIRVANGGHTFRPLWAQKLAHDLIDSELESVICQTQRSITVQPGNAANSSRKVYVGAE